MCHDILVDLPSARAMVRGKHTPKITFCSVLAVWRENFPKLGPNRSRHLSWGVGTPLCKPHRYVLPQRVWFLRCFDLKTSVDFAHFVLNRVWILKKLPECMKSTYFVVSIQNEHERKSNMWIRMDFKKSWSWCSNLSKVDRVSAYLRACLKTG